MATKVLLPKAGMGTSEGTIIKWHKREGDVVTEGEVLAEIEFAKALQELPAPVSGVLRAILVQESETAAVFSELAIIDER